MWKSLADNRLSVTIVVVTFLGMLAISFLMFCEVNKKFHMANNLLPSVQQLRLSFASREAEMRAQYEIRIKDLEGSYAFLQEELNQKKSLAQNQDSPEEIVRKASVKDQFFQLNGKQYQQVIEFLGHIKGDVKPNGQPDHLLSVIGGHPTYNWTHPARTAAAQELQRKMDQINEKLDTDVSIDTFMERVPNDEIKDQFRKFYKVWTDVKNGVHGWNREDAQKEHKYDWENDSIPDFEQMRVAVDNLSEPALNMQRMMEAYKNAPY
ncbi:MAG: hypothetical protein JO253_07965 [Alphaproteobacteria bacterium]|nr:hypothetical protein [Alphaproteobacteria bacterium]